MGCRAGLGLPGAVPEDEDDFALRDRVEKVADSAVCGLSNGSEERSNRPPDGFTVVLRARHEAQLASTEGLIARAQMVLASTSAQL
jgi:hypothetical protein